MQIRKSVTGKRGTWYGQGTCMYTGEMALSFFLCFFFRLVLVNYSLHAYIESICIVIVLPCICRTLYFLISKWKNVLFQAFK